MTSGVAFAREDAVNPVGRPAPGVALVAQGDIRGRWPSPVRINRTR